MLEQAYTVGSEWQIGPIDPATEPAPIHRVAIVTEAFLPKLDGVSKLATLTARHHLNMGREVIIFAPDLRLDSHRTPDTLDGLPVVRVPSGHLWMCPQESRFGLPYLKLNQLDQFQPDLVHLFSPACLAWTGIHYAKRHGIPIVANYQTDLPGYTARYGVGFMQGTMWSYLRHLHNQTTLTLVPTRRNHVELQAKGFKNLRLWYRGINTKRFNPSKRSESMRRRMLAGRPSHSLIVLYVGRLANEKRVDLLRQVAGLEGVAVTIVGDGPIRHELQDAFGPAVHFMGFLTGEELAQAYASADVFGFTGIHEVAGQVVKEALASGLPVLVPNAGGIVEYVANGVNGFVCDIDTADYARKVARLRDDPALRRTLARQARVGATHLPWEKTMAELEKLYAEACFLHEANDLMQRRQRSRARSAAGQFIARAPWSR